MGTQGGAVREGFLEEMLLVWDSRKVLLSGSEGKKALKTEERADTKSETRYHGHTTALAIAAVLDGSSVAQRTEAWDIKMEGKQGRVNVLEELGGESSCLPYFG